MREDEKTSFGERQKIAAAAKSALLAKFKPKETITDPLFAERGAMKAAELADRKKERAVAKAEAAAKAEEAKAQALAAEEAAAAAVLEAQRGARKERKVLTKADSKAKRDAKYAARQARRR